ncbi:XRE family transcriptional regulator [Clostridium oceanicum]|uniref:XRE family transcriptional regulator n=2 Tax=Clostridium oceanicum TaxID=1543 RepID=A0ABN1JRN7_9CLOT
MKTKGTERGIEMSRVSEKIKQVRTKKGFTKKKLGKKLGVSESFITEIEAGRKIINEKLMTRISKVLGEDINDITMSFEQESFKKEKVETKQFPKKEKVNEVWSDALNSVIRDVPLYGYSLNKVLGKKQLPVIGKKIEGYSASKVFFLKIEDNEMMGFRICKDDIAFSYLTHEIDSNSIFLIELNGERVIRQIKRLDSSKILLISNKDTVRTKTANVKEIKVLAKLLKVEFSL